MSRFRWRQHRRCRGHSAPGRAAPLADLPDDQQDLKLSAPPFPLRHPTPVSVAADLRATHRSALALAPERSRSAGSSQAKKRLPRLRAPLDTHTLDDNQSPKRVPSALATHLPVRTSTFAALRATHASAFVPALRRSRSRLAGYSQGRILRASLLAAPDPHSLDDRPNLEPALWAFVVRASVPASTFAALRATRACAFAPALRRSHSHACVSTPKRLTFLLAPRCTLRHRTAPKFATSFSFAHQLRATNPLASPQSTQRLRRPNARLITHRSAAPQHKIFIRRNMARHLSNAETKIDRSHYRGRSLRVSGTDWMSRSWMLGANSRRAHRWRGNARSWLD
jgi:hypothetical protein